MKVLFTALLTILISITTYAQLQNVGIGTTTPNSSAVLDITSTDKGVLIPRMDSTYRVTISDPANGLMVYDNSTNSFWFYQDTSWQEISTSNAVFTLENGVVKYINDDDDFIFGEDALPLSGQLNTGEMFFFDKGKAAFRAGQLSNSPSWNPDSIGIASVAMGNGAKASGDFSVAFGSGTQAVGDQSVAIGRLAHATGHAAFAIGDIVDAIGIYSTAFGRQTTAAGDLSTALGHYTEAFALNSLALGAYNEGGGNPTSWVSTDPILEVGIGTSPFNKENAMTILKDGTVQFKEYSFPNIDGNINQVMTTDGSGNLIWENQMGAFENNNGIVRNKGSIADDFVFGADSLPMNSFSGELFMFDEDKGAFRAGSLVNSSNWATDSIGFGSAAFGHQSLAKGDYSVAMGTESEAIGNYAFAVGKESIATGQGSVAMGDRAQSTGNFSFAMGDGSSANGYGSVALNGNTEANGERSVAIGAITEANGNYSLSSGILTTADSYASTAFGRGNIGGGSALSWVETDPLFEVGIGGPSINLNNALTILKNGTVSFENYTFPDTDGVSGQVLSTDGVGSITWEDKGGLFIDEADVVKYFGSDGKDFIFGQDDLPASGDLVTGTMVFLDASKAAFRAGKITNEDKWGTDKLGIGSFATGIDSEASGNYSFASGSYTEATASNSTALGINSNATGYASTSFGNTTYANGDYSISGGINSLATGEASLAFGSFAQATKFGVSIGNHTQACFNSIALGRYNVGTGLDTTWVATDPLFELGIGTSVSDKNNALTIYKNGIAEFSDSLHTGGNINVGTGIGSRIYLGNTMMQSGGPSILRMDANIRPFDDDSYDLGSSGKRWQEVWATNGVIQTSDRRLKKDISPLTYGLNEILEMQPVSYHWTKEVESDNIHVGLIAQELLEIVPEVVSEEGEYLGVKYAELVPVLIQAIKDQQKIITDQTNVIATLKDQNASTSVTLQEILKDLVYLKNQNIK